MAFPANIQTKINELLTLFVEAGDSINLDRLLANEFKPDDQVDLIILAANIGSTGDGRDDVLDVLIRNGIQ